MEVFLRYKGENQLRTTIKPLIRTINHDDIDYLVGGLVAIFFFPYIGLLILPIDFHIFQRGGPTTSQTTVLYISR